MTSRAATIDACIGIDRGLTILVPEELSDGFESSRLSVEQNLRA